MIDTIRSQIDGAAVKRSVFLGARVLAIPAAELVIVRLALKWLWDIRVGWDWVTDYDFFFPLPLATVAALLLIERGGRLKVHFSWAKYGVHLLCLGQFVLFTTQYHELAVSALVLGNVMWGLSLSLVIVTGIFVHLDVLEVFSHPARFILPFAILFVFTVPIASALFEPLWPSMSYVIGHLVRALLAPFTSVRLLIAPQVDHRVILKSQEFAIAINRKCGGLDGMWLFWQTNIAFLAMSFNRLRWGRWLFYSVAGTLVMVGLNGLRISILFLLGEKLNQMLIYQTTIDVLMFPIHLHLGWVLYTAGVIVLWRMAFAHLLRRREIPDSVVCQSPLITKEILP